MISVILPSRNNEVALAHALAALVPAAADGTVREVIVADAGSDDGTALVADAAGCRIINGSGGLGRDLAQAAALARSDWLMFLSPNVTLELGWQREVHDFIDRVAASGTPRAAVFRHARASFGIGARLAELSAAFRSRLFGAPYLEQGLLIPVRLYREVGGHRALEAMVDVDLARRIGRRRLSFLRARAVRRNEGERSAGFLQGVRKTAAVALFVLRVPASLIGRIAA